MPELQQPLKSLLRTPMSAAHADAMWRNIEARRGTTRLSILQLAGIAGMCALALLAAASLGVRLDGQASSPVAVQPAARAVPRLAAGAAGTPGPLQLEDGHDLAVLRADRGAATQIALSDGSRIELAAGGQLVPLFSNATRADFELSAGQALFDVVPHGPRRWTVVAGSVTVSVIGTRFTVLRDDAGLVRVAVERGLVRVSGQTVTGGTQELSAGQALEVPASAAQAQALALAVAAMPSAAAQPPAAAASRAAASTFASTLNAGNAEQLLALADAARLAGRVDDAARALTRLLERHADDPRAALAALTLGRIRLDQLHQPQLAAQAFEQASALGLPSALAEEGAARAVEAHAKAHQTALAEAAAARYRARFPGGRRSADVEAWVKAE